MISIKFIAGAVVLAGVVYAAGSAVPEACEILANRETNNSFLQIARTLQAQFILGCE